MRKTLKYFFEITFHRPPPMPSQTSQALNEFVCVRNIRLALEPVLVDMVITTAMFWCLMAVNKKHGCQHSIPFGCELFLMKEILATEDINIWQFRVNQCQHVYIC